MRHEDSLVPVYFVVCLFDTPKGTRPFVSHREDSLQTNYSLTGKTEQDKCGNYLELCSQIRNREVFVQAQYFIIFHAYIFISFLLKFLQQDLKSSYNNGKKMFSNYFKFHLLHMVAEQFIFMIEGWPQNSQVVKCRETISANYTRLYPLSENKLVILTSARCIFDLYSFILFLYIYYNSFSTFNYQCWLLSLGWHLK